MADKSPHKSTIKKKAGKTIKEKRAEKKSKTAGAVSHDIVTDSRKH